MIVVALFLCAAGAAESGSIADAVAAASKNRAAVVRTRIAAKADVNAAQADGTTALHWAAHYDDVEAARLLIEAGANVLVAGTAVFGRPDAAQAIRELRGR